MLRVYQTHFDEQGTGPGNCMQTATASFLNVGLESVPNFIEYQDADAKMREFFRAHGFDLVEKPPDFEPPGYYFATGISTQGHEHIVIMRAGAMVHDPNPRHGGMESLDAVLWPVPLNPDAWHLAMDAKLSADVEEAEVVIRAVQPNEGVRVWYQELLQDMARRMAADILRELSALYRPASDRMALDDDPIVALRTAMRAWGRRWQKRFNDLSTEAAASFAGRTQRYTDAALRRRMREAGFTVRFRPTPRQLSAYRAVIAENVGLIRSIPQQFLKDVEGQVWRAVTKGGAMGELAGEIRKRYGVTYRRAALIARDQVNKSKSVLENARRAELGITEAVWQHSSAGKEPRPSHVRMNGKRFDIAKGMWDSAEQKWVQPGELINCRCTSRAIIPGRVSKR